MAFPVQWSCSLRIKVPMLGVSTLSWTSRCVTLACYLNLGLIWGFTCGSIPTLPGVSCKVFMSDIHTRYWWEHCPCTHFELCWLPDVMLIQYLCMQASKGLIGFAIPGTSLFVKEAIAGDNASKVLELFHCLQCCTLNRNWRDERAVDPGAGCNNTSVFPRVMARPKRWEASTDLSIISWRSDSLCAIRTQSSANSASRIRPSSVLVFALRHLRSNNDPSSFYLRYTPWLRSLTAWVSTHVMRRLNRTCAST